MTPPPAFPSNVILAAAIAVTAAIALILVLAIRVPYAIRGRAMVAAGTGILWLGASASAWFYWDVSFDKADDNLPQTGSHALWPGSLAVGAVAAIVTAILLVSIRRAADRIAAEEAAEPGAFPDLGDILSS